MNRPESWSADGAVSLRQDVVRRVDAPEVRVSARVSSGSGPHRSATCRSAVSASHLEERHLERADHDGMQRRFLMPMP